MIANQMKWVGVNNPSPLEPLLISNVEPIGTIMSAYFTQIVMGIGIVYTVPAGSNYLHLSGYTLGGYATNPGWARLGIYDAVGGLVRYIGMVIIYDRFSENISENLLPSIEVPPTYSIRLEVNIANLEAFTIIRGKLSPYQY